MCVYAKLSTRVEMGEFGESKREREKSKMVYRQDRETKEGDSVID